MLSERLYDTAKRMKESASVRDNWERGSWQALATEVAKLERVARAAEKYTTPTSEPLPDEWQEDYEELTGGGSCKAQMEFDEWICKVGIAEGELSTALADLGALGG